MGNVGEQAWGKVEDSENSETIRGWSGYVRSRKGRSDGKLIFPAKGGDLPNP
jgi:hypothetical protein